MYHPGKVLEIFRSKDKNVLSGDETTQALIEMWDENLLTLMVHEKISKEINNNDVILVDYRPREKLPIPNHVVIKILKGEKGKRIWDIYREKYEKGKQIKNPVRAEHSYMG